jgi:hypothetical protein
VTIRSATSGPSTASRAARVLAEHFRQLAVNRQRRRLVRVGEEARDTNAGTGEERRQPRRERRARHRERCREPRPVPVRQQRRERRADEDERIAEGCHDA